MTRDVLALEVLPDGTIKTTTDAVSPVNHQAAEAFLAGLTALTGGPVTRTARHGHTHSHAHTHTHESEGH